MAHTPGPWIVAEDDYYKGEGFDTIAIKSTDDSDVCVALVVADLGEGEHSANARLIAAAPDLLASLKAVLPWADAHDEQYGGGSPEIVAAYAAIAKATGEESRP